MRISIVTIAAAIFLLFYPNHLFAETSKTPEKLSSANQGADEAGNDTELMLKSLLDLRRNLEKQIKISREKLKNSSSEAEKSELESEISRLDKQLSEAANDFERIATGVEPVLFMEKKPEAFSWKKELSSLLEPAIKELKRFTVRARQKSDLKEKIEELNLLAVTASEAVTHLQEIIDAKPEKHTLKEVEALLPEWQNIEERIENKLELAQRELAQLEKNEVSLVESSKSSIRDFFKNRGLYLIVAIFTFIAIVLTCRLLYRFILTLYFKVGGRREQRSFQIRLLYIIFQVLSVIFAVMGLFFVLYLAEDWFLLSMAIIFFAGLAWTVRQGVPRLWQQGRLMLNIGSVREGERITLEGIPWRVESINVFCKLLNPSIEVELRLPIEHLIGQVSRPCKPGEPWFPCKKGDWVVVNGKSRAKVANLSNEQVEVVERGGKRITYPTDVFLQSCPVNLSRNFRVRVPFGLSYNLQDQATAEIPAVLKKYIEARLEQDGYTDCCMNLQVEFFQANSSSLDIIVLADFEGRVADIYKRLERAIQKWCVECCTRNNWEIPFPQLTIHQEKHDS